MCEVDVNEDLKLVVVSLYVIIYHILFVIIFFNFFFLGQNLVADFQTAPVDRTLTPVDRRCLRENFGFFISATGRLFYRTSRPIRVRDSLYLFGRPALNPSRPIVELWLIFVIFLHCFSHSLTSLSANRWTPVFPKFPTFNPLF